MLADKRVRRENRFTTSGDLGLCRGWTPDKAATAMQVAAATVAPATARKGGAAMTGSSLNAAAFIMT